MLETEATGNDIAAKLSMPACVYLQGAMGAGKTTLAKSIIQGFGYTGDVTSPTYNLIQEYPVETGGIYHMDLYRLEDPAELEFLAIDDLWSDQSLFLIEWAENGAGYLRPADFVIDIRKKSGKNPEYREILLSQT